MLLHVTCARVLEEMKDAGINLCLPVLAGLTWFL